MSLARFSLKYTTYFPMGIMFMEVYTVVHGVIKFSSHMRLYKTQ